MVENRSIELSGGHACIKRSNSRSRQVDRLLFASLLHLATYDNENAQSCCMIAQTLALVVVIRSLNCARS